MQTQQKYYTPDEYLAQEEVAEFRSEYRDGEIGSVLDKLLSYNE